MTNLCPICAGKLWSRSLKLAYTLLNKLGTKNDPVLKPGDRVRLLTVLHCTVNELTRP